MKSIWFRSFPSPFCWEALPWSLSHRVHVCGASLDQPGLSVSQSMCLLVVSTPIWLQNRDFDKFDFSNTNSNKILSDQISLVCIPESHASQETHWFCLEFLTLMCHPQKMNGINHAGVWRLSPHGLPKPCLKSWKWWSKMVQMVHVSAVQAACWWSSPCFVGDLGALKLPWKGPSPVTLWVRSACWQHRHRADCEVRC